VIVLAADRTREGEFVAPLEAQGYRISPVSTPEEAVRILRDARPALLIVADGTEVPAGGGWAEVRTAARGLGIPVLKIVEANHHLDDLLARSSDADEWVFRSRVAAELPSRAARLIRRGETAAEAAPQAGMAPLDSHFIALLVHDLRTPLNVIGLSLRMIDQSIPKGDPDLEEDLRFVEENFKQIERMLTQLGDYYRLFEPEIQLTEAEFSPMRLLDELLETRTVKAGAKMVPARAVVLESCPEAVALDPSRARTAIAYALANASAAAGGGTVRVVLRGEPGRWIIEIRLDQPPPGSVQSHQLHPRRFERLCGTAAERRGMELAIAARVSQMFGGSARLDVEEGKGTAIVLDWPTRLTRS
jgi:signal transduction histidine kinase